MPPRLSKSRFTAGLQCHRLLWWRTKEPEAPELVPDPMQQAVFDAGSRVGSRATEEFPGGVMVDMQRLGGPSAALKETRRLLDAGETTIFEAAFRHEHVFSAIDILHREGLDWVLTEVKATTRVKDQHIPDAAIQTWIARGQGIDVGRTELMHLNPDHRHPDHLPLFVRADISDEVEAFIPTIGPELDAQREMLAGDLPDVEPGPQCTTPYKCPFFERCNEPRPKYSVHELYSGGKLAATLSEAGYELIPDVPLSRIKSPIQRRQHGAVSTGTVVVEDALARQLAAFEQPFAYLDFETIGAALPVWDGVRPWHHTPVQFSVHHQAGPHFEYLAEGPGDPRRELAHALLAATRDAKTVFAYNAPFERRQITQLADRFPDLADELHDLAGRLADLLPIVRNNVYHPDFAGSFSLKAVAPALLGATYGDLEIADGGTAAAQLETYLLRPHELTEDPTKLRADLLAYCKRDTEVLMALHRGLLKLAEAT